jgi:hypothetical protein
MRPPLPLPLLLVAVLTLLPIFVHPAPTLPSSSPSSSVTDADQAAAAAEALLLPASPKNSEVIGVDTTTIIINTAHTRPVKKEPPLSEEELEAAEWAEAPYWTTPPIAEQDAQLARPLSVPTATTAGGDADLKQHDDDNVPNSSTPTQEEMTMQLNALPTDQPFALPPLTTSKPSPEPTN